MHCHLRPMRQSKQGKEATMFSVKFTKAKMAEQSTKIEKSHFTDSGTSLVHNNCTSVIFRQAY